MKAALIFPPGSRPNRPNYVLAYLYTLFKDKVDVLDTYDLNQAVYNRVWPETKPVLDYSFYKKASIPCAVFSAINHPLTIENLGFRVNMEFSSTEEIIDFIDGSEAKFCNLYGDSITPLSDGGYHLLMNTIQHFDQLLSAMALSRLLRLRGFTGIFCVGGAYVNRFSPFLLSNKRVYGFFDYIVLGDAETTGNRLINLFAGGLERSVGDIPGTSYLDEAGTNVVVNKPSHANMRDLNFDEAIDYSYVKKYLYYPNDIVLPVMSSRVCHYRRCKFCSNNLIERTTPFRKARNVFRDMESGNRELSITKFRFIDDTVPKPVLIELAKIIATGGSGYTWGASVRFEKWLQDKDVLQKLYRGGCRFLFLGLESGSQAVLNKMKKGISLSTAKAIIKLAKDCAIRIHISVMLGYPGETPEDISCTEKLVYELKDYFNVLEVNFFVLLNKTDVFHDLVEGKRIKVTGVKPFSNIVEYEILDKEILKARALALETYARLREWTRENGKNASAKKIAGLFL